MTSLLIASPSLNGRGSLSHRLGSRGGRHRLSRHQGHRDRSVVSVVVCCGGSGIETALALVAQNPALADAIFCLDTDGTLNMAQVGERMLLASQGHESTAIDHRVNFSLIRTDPIAELVTLTDLPPGDGDGVGKFRHLAIRRLAHQLDELKPRLLRWLRANLAKFSGPGPKKLIVSIVASLSGGTGSALIIPLAVLIRETTRTLSPAHDVVVGAHVVSPIAFGAVVATPDEFERDLANASQTLHELNYSQAPAHLTELTQALGVNVPRRTLFDTIAYYDVTDSVGCSQTLDQIWSRIAANINASQCQALRQREGAREINPFMARLGTLEGRVSSRVIESARSVIVHVPIQPLGKAYLAQELTKLVTGATAAPDEVRVKTLVSTHGAGLGIDQQSREVENKLSPAAWDPQIATMSDGDTVAAAQRYLDRWEHGGREELFRKQRILVRDAKRETEQRVTACLHALQQEARSIPELSRTERELLNGLNDRIARNRKQREQLAAGDPHVAHRQARAQMKDKRRLFNRNDEGRRDVVNTARAVIEVEVKQAALVTIHDAILVPLAEAIRASLANAEGLEEMLVLKGTELELQMSDIRDQIGIGDAEVMSVVDATEVPKLLDSLARQIAERLGPPPSLPLDRLLASRGDEQTLQNLFEDLAGAAVSRFHNFLDHFVRDLHGFTKTFGLAFRLEEWLVETVSALALPANLNLSIHGPGLAPKQSYIALAPSLEADVKALLAEAGAEMFELVVGDPFEVVVRQKISGVDFESIPNLGDYVQAMRKYEAAAKVYKHPWYILASSGHLAAAGGHPLTSPPVSPAGSEGTQGESPTAS